MKIKKHNKIASFLIFIILIIIGYAGYKNYKIADQNNSNLVNWETYRSKDFSSNFQFQYPGDFETYQEKGFFAKNEQYSLNLTLIENTTENPEYNDWIEQIKKDVENDSENSKMEINPKYTTYLTSRMSAEGIFERIIFVVFNEKIIYLNLSADTRLPGNEEPQIYGKLEQIADQILSTFKFTE